MKSLERVRGKLFLSICRCVASRSSDLRKQRKKCLFSDYRYGFISFATANLLTVISVKIARAWLKLLSDCWNVSSPSLFYGYYFGRFSFKLAELVPLPYACGGSIVQIGCAIHLLLFQDGMIMSLWTVDVYPYKARLGIFFLQDYFVWLIWMDLIHSCTAFIIWLFLICFSMSLSRENNTVW